MAKKWDAVYISKLIASGDIDKVIQHYQERYYGPERDPQDAFRIADLYVRKKDYTSAMQWYEKEKQLIYTSKVNLFNYANTCRLMGEYQKALDGYLMYAANTGDVDKVMELANQCEKILKASANVSSYKLDNYAYNTSADETNVAVLRNNPVYATIKNADSKEEKPSYSQSQIVRNFEGFSEPVKAYAQNIPNTTITAVSYTKDGNTVVFSARENNVSTKKKVAKENDKLYMAANLGANFLKPVLLPFNVDGYNLKNPSVSSDGNVIYFSSNMPGGFGGYDIWKSTLENGKWSKPVNLGNLLNTKNDEINPFIVQDKTDKLLYFSSNREGGFGGYDIYLAKNIDNIWQEVEMQPAPINSAGDDISIIYDNDIRTGYVSSDRLGGKGGFDIYRFIPFNLKLIINVKDSATGQPIDYAYTQLSENGVKVADGVSGETGQAIYQVGKNKTFAVNISKDNYKPASIKINTNGKGSGDSSVADVFLKQDEKFSILKGATNNLSLENYIFFTGHIIDASTNKPARTAKMRMVNYTTKKVREIDLDQDGKFEIKLLLNNNYKIIVESQDNKATDEITTYGVEKNSVKVRDYILQGNKLKMTENKVYKPTDVPATIKLSDNNAPKGNNNVNEPITQTKIDSLIKVISKDNPTVQLNNTTTTVQKQAVVSTPQAPPAPVKIEEPKQTPQVTQPKPAEKVIKEIPVEEVKETTIITQTVVETTPEKIPEDTIRQKAAELKKEELSMAATGINDEKQAVVKSKKQNKIKQPEDNIESTVPETTVEIPKEEITPKEEIKTTNAETPKLQIVVPKKPVETPEKLVEIKENKIAEKTITTTVKEVVQEKTNQPDATQTPSNPVITTQDNKSAAEEELPELYYKIQLGSYDVANLTFPEYNDIGKVEMVQAYGRYIYRLGNFTNLEEAKAILEKVRKDGYFVAFILQYNKSKITGIVN